MSPTTYPSSSLLNPRESNQQKKTSETINKSIPYFIPCLTIKKRCYNPVLRSDSLRSYTGPRLKLRGVLNPFKIKPTPKRHKAPVIARSRQLDRKIGHVTENFCFLETKSQKKCHDVRGTQRGGASSSPKLIKEKKISCAAPMLRPSFSKTLDQWPNPFGSSASFTHRGPRASSLTLTMLRLTLPRRY